MSLKHSTPAQLLLPVNRIISNAVMPLSIAGDVLGESASTTGFRPAGYNRPWPDNQGSTRSGPQALGTTPASRGLATTFFKEARDLLTLYPGFRPTTTGTRMEVRTSIRWLSIHVRVASDPAATLPPGTNQSGVHTSFRLLRLGLSQEAWHPRRLLVM